MNVLAKKAVQCNRVGTYPFLFYGGAEICSTIKGMRGGGVPTKAMQKLVKDHFDCKTVNEYYTSQICVDCNYCLSKCMNQDKDEADKFRKKIRGVRYCNNCAGQGNGQNRLKSCDGNAARNILIKGHHLLHNGNDHPGYCQQTVKLVSNL